MRRFLQYFDLNLWQNDHGENVLHLLAGADMELRGFDKRAIKLALLDIQTLIKADSCLLEATDHSGQTPLHCAIRTNKPSKILSYLATKCPMAIAMQDVQGQTPLHSAMKTHQPSNTLLLLAAKCPAAITMTDKDGKTPLHIAFEDLPADASVSHRSFHHQICSMLKSLHSDLWDIIAGLCTSLMIQDNKGRTPLHYAAITSLDVARAVGDLINLVLLTETTFSPELYRGENTPVDVRAVLSVPDEEGFTPLRCCANDSGMTILHRLLDYRGSSWNHMYLGTVMHMLQCDPRVAVLQDHNANTLLHFAVMLDTERTNWTCDLMISMCRLMIAENRDILTIRNNKGMTPLHCTALMNRRGEAVVRLMVEKDAGVPINARDQYGQTPLHYAVSKCHAKHIMCLLENGVNANLTDRQERLALHLVGSAEWEGNDQDWDEKTLTRLISASHIESFLLRDVQGNLPLFQSATNSHMNEVFWLLRSAAKSGLFENLSSGRANISTTRNVRRRLL